MKKEIKKQMPSICELCKHVRSLPEKGYYCERLKTEIKKDMYKAKTCLFKENKDGE